MLAVVCSSESLCSSEGVLPISLDVCTYSAAALLVDESYSVRPKKILKMKDIFQQEMLIIALVCFYVCMCM